MVIIKQLRPTIVLFLIFSLITGLAYPFLVTGIGQLVFPKQVMGSLIFKKNHLIGSQLIGQNFSSPRYFWGRPSATPDYPYNAKISKGSNLGPLNPALISKIEQRIQVLQTENESIFLPPIDLITASGSGLDPEISPAAAWYQVSRIARNRKIPIGKIQRLVDQHIQKRQLGFLGEARVNVLQLNLALDKLE